jgi:hypothetical protein
MIQEKKRKENKCMFNILDSDNSWGKEEVRVRKRVSFRQLGMKRGAGSPNRGCNPNKAPKKHCFTDRL